MIQSFKSKEAEALFNGIRVRRFEAIAPVARRKLAYLHAARVLQDLAVPTGNRLEPLGGNRRGQHSIRVNDQCRICFVWADNHAEDVEIVDYH